MMSRDANFNKNLVQCIQCIYNVYIRPNSLWPSRIYGTNSSFSWVHLSHSVVSDSLWPHRLQHARLPCPSPTTRACSNSCPLSWWCHLTMSSSVVCFSCLQSFPASGSFPMSQFFASVLVNVGKGLPVSIPLYSQGNVLITYKDRIKIKRQK